MHVACNYHTKDQVIEFLTGLNEKFYVVKLEVCDKLCVEILFVTKHFQKNLCVLMNADIVP